MWAWERMKANVMCVCPETLIMMPQTWLPKQQTLLFEPVTTSLNSLFFLLAFQNTKLKRGGWGGHHAAMAVMEIVLFLCGVQSDGLWGAEIHPLAGGGGGLAHHH